MKQEIIADSNSLRDGKSGIRMGLSYYSQLSPTPNNNDVELEKVIQATLDAYHYPVASATMSKVSDDFGALNGLEEVFGAKGLYVIAPSIFLAVTSTATNPTVFIATKKVSDPFLNKN